MTDETIIQKQTDATCENGFKPLKSPLGYLGGKSRLAAQIIERIPEHVCYVEPFTGAGWVYFTKEPSRVEVLNDLDGELVTFWRVVQNHLPEFLRCLEGSLVTRAGFDHDMQQNPKLLTDVQRAVRYYRLQRMGFGGKPKNRTFGASSARASSFNPLRVEQTLKETNRRLARTTIESLEACACIRRYDSPKTFFYIDPPYWDLDHYAVPFSKEDFERLRDTLRELKGKFLLSLNDTPEVREFFKEFIIESVGTKYFLGIKPDSRNVDRKEVFLHNLNEVFHE